MQLERFYVNNKNTIDKILLVFTVIISIYLFANYIYSYIAPFVNGFVLSLALHPLALFISKKTKLGKGISAFISILLLVVLIGVLGTGLISKILFEATAFLENVPRYLNDLKTTTDQWVLRYHDLNLYIPEEMQTAIQSVSQLILSSVTGLLGTGVRTGSVGIVAFLPGMLLRTLLSIISTFFFIKDRDIIIKFFSERIPPSLAEKLIVIKTGVLSAFTGYIKAQFVLMCITCMICITGLLILRYPYALFLGIMIAMVDFLPVFGTGTIFLPWALFNLISGDYSRAIGLLIIYGIAFVTRQSLEPRVVGEQIGVYPLVTLMSIYVGLKIFGPLGFVIGPVVVVVIKAILDADKHKAKLTRQL